MTGTEEPFLEPAHLPSIAIMSEQEMRNELFLVLVHRYEQQRDQYMTLSKQTIDCSFARLAIAELRNEGLVEEQVRGVIRLTALGYRTYLSTPPSYTTVA